MMKLLDKTDGKKLYMSEYDGETITYLSVLGDGLFYNFSSWQGYTPTSIEQSEKVDWQPYSELRKLAL